MAEALGSEVRTKTEVIDRARLLESSPGTKGDAGQAAPLRGVSQPSVYRLVSKHKVKIHS